MTHLVDVIMGGPSGEAPVSRNSGEAIAAALESAGCDVQRVDINERLDLDKLRSGAVAFNIVHGIYGEDGTLQRELDAANVCYVGSDAEASELCMNKEGTKQTLKRVHVPTPIGMRVSLKNVFDPRELRFETMTGLVVKPAIGGSSLGLHIIDSPSFLLPAVEAVLNDLGPIDILIEEKLSGPEYTVALIEEADGLRALPPICITAEEGCYDYEAKYNRDDTDYKIINDAALIHRLQDLAERTYRACGCRDFARVDIMANDQGDLKVLEVNTLPGFTDHSLVPKAAAAAGISFSELCLRLVQQAAQRMEAYHGR